MSAPAWAGDGPAHPGEVRLSAVELAACFDMLDLGATPPTFRLPSPARSEPERRQHLDAVLLDLQHRGLTDRGGPNERVGRLLRVLAHPDHQIDLIRSEPAGTLVAIGAAAHGGGTLATRQGDEITLAPIPGTALAPTVVGLLGPLTPGSGQTVTIPADVFDTARHDAVDGKLSTWAERLTEMGIPRLDALSCLHMCTGVHVLGQLGTVHYIDGSARLSPWVIGFHRADAGYYLQLRKPRQHDGTMVVTICPLDTALLTQLVEELLKTGAYQP